MSDVFTRNDSISGPGRPAVMALAMLFLVFPLLGCGDGANSSPAERGARASTEQQTGQPTPGADGQVTRTVEIRIGGEPVTAEIADNDALRARGLMYRDSLAENRGMLFVYGTAQVRSFWMRNTRIPLDIAFIDANGVILNVLQMEPQSDDNYFSQGPMMYALEMNQGWFEAHGVGPGDRLEF